MTGILLQRTADTVTSRGIQARGTNRLWFIVLAVAASCALSVVFARNAKANYYGVPAINMQSFPTPAGNDPGFEFNLMRVGAEGELVSGLNLPSGQQICEFMLLARDNDPNNDAEAQLVRKRFARNTDPFAAPQRLARVRTRNANTIFREIETTNIRHPVIDPRFEYAVLLDLPPGNSIELVRLSVQIQPTCP